MGATLKDVSYSVKQNGIMVNLDYTEPIDDDDIIGWKSDRGWVYLTLLGVRAPKGKKPQEDFSGEVRKIVIDDFDESTQLAILIRKPILGYDIINSKTSPSTIVFIHTEMKKSEVATLKEYIKEKGTSVFNVAKSSGFPKYNTNFKNAFDEARKELGPNAIFEYHGKLYTTNHPGEKEVFSKSVLTEKPKSLAGKGENNSPTVNDILDLSSANIPIEETYVDIDTGDTQIFVNPINKKQDQPEVRGIALDKNQVQVSFRKLPDRPGVAASICLALAENNLLIDTIVQSERISSLKTKDISLTMNKQDREKANLVFEALTKKLPGSYIEDGPAIAKVSTVGAGMAFKVGTAGKIFRALADQNINIEMIATSEIRTSCIVLEKDCDKAVSAIHKHFELEK